MTKAISLIFATRIFTVFALQDLKLVHILYRHGDRTPVDPYPNDPYKRESWNVGYGQLTSIGKRAHFKLGQWFRERYDGFLSSNYSEEEIIVRSTDVDRTLMSAMSNLAGLYPPSGYQKWNPDLDWQPIPVHTVPLDLDNLLSSHADCPRFDHLQDEIMRSDWMTSIVKDNQEMFQYISQHSGFNLSDIVHLNYVYDTLFVETVHNKTLPEWTKKYFPGGPFEELSDLSFIVNTHTHELKRLKGGPYVKEVISHIDDFVKGTMEPKKRKVFMYSAHDTTISSILNTLNVFDVIAPPYRSAVMIELYENQELGYHVKILYRNDTTREPYQLILPGCEANCPLFKFKDLTASIIPEDWDVECEKAGYSSRSQAVQNVTLIAAVASSVMATIVMMAAFVTICKCKKKEAAHRYQRVDQLEIAIEN